MYGRGGMLGATTATTATTGAVVLPNTGGNFAVTLAIAVAAGLIVWGALYARSTHN